jgi:hypothetical protein
MQTCFFSKEKLSKGTLRNFQSLCLQTESLGLSPNEDDELVDLILEKESEIKYETKSMEIDA